ncbi:MAG: UDP-2,3-diacylglucosamine diphosphatase [Chitinophagaceae bacterium]
MISYNLDPGKKVYFLSDFHLGAPNKASSLIREKRVVAFLKEARKDAAHIFIVGDIFDFWFEYKQVVPKGYTRLLGQLADMSDEGITIHLFTGNHDMWMKGYFEAEFDAQVFYDPQEFQFNGKKFFIAHGDGLGPGDHRYKFLKAVFRNKISQKLFGILAPNFGISLANFFSRKSRESTGNSDAIFLGEDKEWLIIFSKDTLQKTYYDYFIYGHRHLPMDLALGGNSRYINLGDWINYFSYAEFDGNDVALKYYP